MAGPGGTAALLQTAAAGDFDLLVYVRLAGNAAGQAGLVLYTDDNDWLTLLLDQSGHISLCIEAWQRGMPCATLTLPASTAAGGVWLRVAHQGKRFTGAVSVDTVNWRTVGSWVPDGGGTTSDSEAQSELAFTGWGVLSRGSAAAWFGDFATVLNGQSHA